MASQYPTISDSEFDLQKKIANNTAEIDDNSTGIINDTAINITGLNGNGFITLPSQSVDPAAPASGSIRIFSNSANKFSWIGASGFTRNFDGTLTASRSYVLPDVSGTFVLTTNPAAGVAITNVNSITGTASTNLAITSSSGGDLTLTAAAGRNFFIKTNGGTTGLSINASQLATFSAGIIVTSSVTAAASTDLTLNAGSTAGHVVLVPIGTANLVKINTASTRGAGLSFQTSGTENSFVGATAQWLASGTNKALALASDTGGEINFYINGSSTASMQLSSGGKLLVNTTTDSSDGAIQLAAGAADTTSGLGFSTDTSLFRTAAGRITISGTAGTAILKLDTGTASTASGLSFATQNAIKWDIGYAVGTNAGSAFELYNRVTSANALSIASATSNLTLGGTTVTISGSLGGNAGYFTTNTLAGGYVTYFATNDSGNTAKFGIGGTTTGDNYQNYGFASSSASAAGFRILTGSNAIAQTINNSQLVLFAAAGTAGAPTICVTDNNTGIYRPSGGAMAFSTSGVLALTLTSGQAATFAGLITAPLGAKIGGNAGADIGATNNGITIASGNGYGWSAGASPSAAMDTTLTRISVGVVGVTTAFQGGHNSSDGTVGLTQASTTTLGKSITVKNGLITAFA